MEKAFEKNPTCAAMAGIKSIYYADCENVTICLPVNGGISVDLSAGHSWSLIEADGATANANYEEPLAWRHQVQLTYHGNQNEVEADFTEMTGRRFLVKVVDNNDTEWLYGQTCSPLRFTFSSENDGQADGQTAYTLSFEALCPNPARIIKN